MAESTLDAVIDALRAILADVEAALDRARQAVDVANRAVDAADAYGQGRAVAEARQLRATIEEATDLLAKAREMYAELLARATTHRDGTGVTTASAGTRVPQPRVTDDQPPDERRLKELAGALPPPVTKGSGEKLMAGGSIRVAARPSRA